jgi:DNase/tRNase domain of colicin-like bacteriocin
MTRAALAYLPLPASPRPARSCPQPRRKHLNPFSRQPGVHGKPRQGVKNWTPQNAPGLSPKTHANPPRITPVADKSVVGCSVAAERVGATLGPSGRQYSVAFETKLDASVWGRSDSVHFNRANAALDDVLRADPVFATQMDTLIPGIQSSVAKAGGRQNPTNWTWHHGSEPGTMQLVPTAQHRSSLFWDAFHPNGVGGYSTWAIPAGAPPRR